MMGMEKKKTINKEKFLDFIEPNLSRLIIDEIDLNRELNIEGLESHLKIQYKLNLVPSLLRPSHIDFLILKKMEENFKKKYPNTSFLVDNHNKFLIENHLRSAILLDWMVFYKYKPSASALDSHSDIAVAFNFDNEIINPFSPFFRNLKSILNKVNIELISEGVPPFIYYRFIKKKKDFFLIALNIPGHKLELLGPTNYKFIIINLGNYNLFDI